MRNFHPPSQKFDGVIGGPPCQLFSTLAKMNPHAGKHGNQIPEYERCVSEAAPDWFVMENVPDAPLPIVPGYIVRDQLLRDVWVGGDTTRLRRFSFGTRDGRVLRVATLALHRTDPEPTVLAGHGPALGQRVRGIVGRDPIEMARLQGLPADFDLPGFTVHGKKSAIGNGVPMPMGRAIAKAVSAAVGHERRIA